MSLVLQSSGGGSVTLEEPVTASNFTITVPAVTGTMATLTTPSFVSTIGVGGATPANSGAGITFPATQSASSDANTLDDYEEGTWTPSVSSQGGSLGSTTVNFATYTKIGRQVTASFKIKINSIGTATGALYVTLPFSSNSSTYIGVGREDDATGIMLQGVLNNTFVCAVFNYLNNSPIATGNGIVITITFFIP